MKDNKVIVISELEPGLPYSKGLRAAELMVTGLSPYRAYQIAEEVEERLRAKGVASVTRDELNDLTEEVLVDIAGERYARNFLRWQEVRKLDVPIVVLIGGATGVGKSTLATQLAVRLNIVRVVATDAIREVMRAMLSEQMMPSLYRSSFDAGSALREPPGRSQDKVVVGFREQTAAVAVGIEALMERAAVEGTSAILEGAHVVPGFFDAARYQDRILAVPVVITVEDEDMHRGHFVARSTDASDRPFERYLEGFADIRRVQKYIKSQALHPAGRPPLRAHETHPRTGGGTPMKLFLDTANLEEIRTIKRWGVLSGATTNPTLLSKEHADIELQMKEVCNEVPGPVSLETTAETADDIFEEGLRLAAIADNAVVKVVMTPDGIEAGKRLADRDIPVNVTLVFSPAQAILAAEIGATYVSPFLGRLDDVGTDGMYLLGDICEIYEAQGYETNVLAASLRHPVHVVTAAKLGADVATMPFAVFTKLVKHPLTDIGVTNFLKDWNALKEELAKKEGD